MKTKKDIHTIEDLRAEIARLKVLKFEQEAYLGDQFSLLEYKLEAPMRLYERIASFLPSAKEAFLPNGKSMGSDWVTNSLRVGLPFLFNKVLFRKAGFIKKGLLLLASQQAAGFLNKDRLADLIDKITTLIHPSNKGKKKKKETDYGIPPDSETY
jgi:hypothetical protein